MERHLFCLSNSVWDADDYLNDRNCNPQYTDLYLYATKEQAEQKAQSLYVSNDIYNDCLLFEGDVDEETIIELTGFESISDFDEALKEPYSETNFGEDEKKAVCEYIVQEPDSIDSIECANYDFNKSIEGAVIVVWSWHKYTGYARKCEEIRFARKGETEKMLTKQDRVFVNQVDVVLKKEEVEKCDDLNEELISKLLDYDNGWKWTNPSFVKREIELL